MSKLCQNWQKWQWPIWCISSRWRERGQALFAFQKYLLLCTFQGKDLLPFTDLLPFKAKQIFVENQAILKHDQHVARRIGHKWVTTCNTLPSLDPKKRWQEYHLTSTYGIPAWRWEVPPNNFGRILPPRLASAPLPSKAPTSLLPLNSRGAVWGGFGPLATYHFFWRNHYFGKYIFAL